MVHGTNPAFSLSSAEQHHGEEASNKRRLESDSLLLIVPQKPKGRHAASIYYKKRRRATTLLNITVQYYSLASVDLVSLWVSIGSSSRPSTVFSSMFTTYNACDVQHSIYLVGIGTPPPAGCRWLHSLITDFPPVSCCRTRLSLSARTLSLDLLLY